SEFWRIELLAEQPAGLRDQRMKRMQLVHFAVGRKLSNRFYNYEPSINLIQHRQGVPYTPFAKQPIKSLDILVGQSCDFVEQRSTGTHLLDVNNCLDRGGQHFWLDGRMFVSDGLDKLGNLQPGKRFQCVKIIAMFSKDGFGRVLNSLCGQSFEHLFNVFRNRCVEPLYSFRLLEPRPVG